MKVIHDHQSMGNHGSPNPSSKGNNYFMTTNTKSHLT